MSANFTPTLHSYKMQGAFRYWVQKVLPLVYDDSLSYYELLNKVVDYLNNMMEDENNLIEDVTSLRDAFVNLQNYVNDYFDNLDLSGVVEQKINELLDSGALQEMIDNYFAETTEFVHRLDQKVNVYNADTGWVELTLRDGIEVYGFGSEPSVRKIGNIVYLRGGIEGMSSAGNVRIADIPSWAKPAGGSTIIPIVSSLNAVGVLNVGDYLDLHSSENLSNLLVPIVGSWMSADETVYPQVFNYIGTVSSFANLPANARVGDVYTVTALGKDYVWTGGAWSLFAESGLEALSYEVDDLTDRVDDIETGVDGLKESLDFVRATNITYPADGRTYATIDNDTQHNWNPIPNTVHPVSLPENSGFPIGANHVFVFGCQVQIDEGTTIQACDIKARLINDDQNITIDCETVDHYHWALGEDVVTVFFRFDVLGVFPLPSPSVDAWVVYLDFYNSVDAPDGINHMYITVHNPYFVDYTGIPHVQQISDWFVGHWTEEFVDCTRVWDIEQSIDSFIEKSDLNYARNIKYLPQSKTDNAKISIDNNTLTITIKSQSKYLNNGVSLTIPAGTYTVDISDAQLLGVFWNGTSFVSQSYENSVPDNWYLFLMTYSQNVVYNSLFTTIEEHIARISVGVVFMYVSQSKLHIYVGNADTRCVLQNASFTLPQGDMSFDCPSALVPYYLVINSATDISLKYYNQLNSADNISAYVIGQEVFPLSANIVANKMPLPSQMYSRANVPFFINRERLGYDIVAGNIVKNDNNMKDYGSTVRLYNYRPTTWRLADRFNDNRFTIAFSENSANIANKKILMVGDSITNRGWIQRKLIDYVPSLTFLGTKQTGTGQGVTDYMCEATPGATAKQMIGSGSAINNDFASYVSNSLGGVAPDYVIIEFGLNETSASDYVTYVQSLIDGIKNYDSNIKVYVLMPFERCLTQNMGTLYNFSYTQYITGKRIILESSSFTDCVLIPTYFIFDDRYDYTHVIQSGYGYGVQIDMVPDFVHPSETVGFLKLADMIYNYLGI